MSHRSSTRGMKGLLVRASDKQLKKKKSGNAAMRKTFVKKKLQKPVKRKCNDRAGGQDGGSTTDDEAAATPRMNHGTKYCTDVVQIQVGAEYDWFRFLFFVFCVFFSFVEEVILIQPPVRLIRNAQRPSSHRICCCCCCCYC